MAAQRELILECLRHASVPLDDDTIARRTNISPRQSVNQICRRLSAEGVLLRRAGPDGKLVNELREGGQLTEVDGAPSGAVSMIHVAAGSSSEQRAAEPIMLATLGSQLGLELAPRRISHPSGARVELDGADDALTVLVECWAHQGPAKVAQKSKLVKDAVKLFWIANSLPDQPRLLICVTDPAAVRHLTPRSWETQAIAELGVEVVVVDLPEDTRRRIAAAQVRQFR